MSAPTLEALQTAMRDAERQRAFWQAHREEFLRKYPNQFVAVKDGVVVATADDLQELVLALRGLELRPDEVWVQYMDPKPQTLIL
ncbi:MAG: DUF5678 domain-containing protein [Dehalococcoidia bacterium]